MSIRLYQLMSSNHAFENILNKRLKISRIEELNDPFELLPTNLTDKQRRRALRSFKSNFHEAYGVVCFSTGWQNPVLWSHYGDKHHGICLGFDVEERCAFPVSYVDQLADIDFEAIADHDLSRLDFARDEVAKILITKFSHWRYEDEFRVFATLDHSTKTDAGHYFYDFDQKLILREVILGARCVVPVKQVCDAVSSAFPTVRVTKSRLAFSKFGITEDKRFVDRIARYMRC